VSASLLEVVAALIVEFNKLREGNIDKDPSNKLANLSCKEYIAISIKTRANVMTMPDKDNCQEALARRFDSWKFFILFDLIAARKANMPFKSKTNRNESNE
jgi:hypothetical protein